MLSGSRKGSTQIPKEVSSLTSPCGTPFSSSFADRLVQSSPALDVEAQVVEPDAVLVECVALARNRSQPKQVAALVNAAGRQRAPIITRSFVAV